MAQQILNFEPIYPKKTFIDKLPILLRWILLVPVFILSIFVSRIIFDYFIKMIFIHNVSLGRNQWNDYIFNFKNINEFLNNWWIISCEEFLVLLSSIHISLSLLPDEKKTIGFYILTFIQLISYILIILIGFINKSVELFPLIFVLISYSLPFLVYYYQEIR